MEIKLKILKEEDSEFWDKLVESSSYGTIFHTWKWLKIIEKYSNSKLYHIVAFKEDITVGIYPIFIIRKGLINVAFSPPPGFDLYLGPLFLAEILKQDKKESCFIEFQKKIDDFLFSELRCKYVEIHSSPGLYDCRPLKWCGYQVIPRYTSRINLTKGVDYVWSQFDKKLRVGINRAIRENVIIEEANEDDLKFIIDNTINKRYDELSIRPMPVDSNHILELYKEFNTKNMKFFIARYKGERVSALIAPTYKGVMYFWIGAIKELAGVPQNDLLQWEAIKWASNNGLAYYENMGTGDLVRFRSSRSKYNPEPIMWFESIKYSSNLYKILKILASIKNKREKILKIPI